MKNSIDNTGNLNRDLPACSAVPQPTAPPRALSSFVYWNILSYVRVRCVYHDGKCEDNSEGTCRPHIHDRPP